MNSFTSRTAKHAFSATALALSLLSFNALATSPAHPNGHNQNMISNQVFSATNYQRLDATKMFPIPAEGMEQHILTLPRLSDESNYMVEIQIGQTKMLDCNKQMLTGELKQHSVKGWGYNYYQVDSITEGPSTRMACIHKAEHAEAFVQIRDELKLSYDSRLAKVFYLPQGSELRYRVWKVESQFSYSKSAVAGNS
ncbi:serine protease inhibitor ecotin [uncultured Shewanella sp.]|uniref:serine protease inhibitor ecotin n=1 Tax=Shewanella atlantica TaxID=271099 RepID=UPI002620CE27|nr:serine protease inhibitor ecotin [uncultured Shewanella sp.]